MRRLLLLVGTIAVTLGCARWVKLADVPKPHFASVHSTGFCGSHDYVDSHGQGWHEHGCEDGKGNEVKATRHVSDEEWRALAMAFASLPRPVHVDQPTACAGPFGVAQLVQDDGSGGATVWDVCMTSWDQLPAPYAEVDALLRRLTGAPSVAPKAATTDQPPASTGIDAPRTLRFAFDVSREISCSQSFETTSTSGSYVLTMTPPHAATLVFTRVESETFGENRFDGPGSSTPPNHTEKRTVSTFEGTVDRTGGTLSFTLARKADECGAKCGAPLVLTCQDASAPVVTFDAKGKHVADHAIVRCTPGFGLAPELATGGWKDGLAFADGSGLYLDYQEAGPMEGPPELRPAP